MRKKNNYKNYTDEDFAKAVKESFSIAQVLDKLGLIKAGGNYDQFRVNVARLNLDVSHFTGKVWSKGKCVKTYSNYTRSKGRKNFLIKERGHKCEDCKNTEWKGKPIILELHHINGNRADNRKENLQILCCNCHATTDNWRAKNKNARVAELADATDLEQNLSATNENWWMTPFKVGETLTDNADGNAEPSPKKREGVENRRGEPKFCFCGNEITLSRRKYCSRNCYQEANRNSIPKVPEILEAFKAKKSYVQVGNYFGVSDNAVKKWVESYGIQDMVKAYSSAQKDSFL